MTAPVRRAGVDAATKATVQKLPMLSVKAGPRDGEDWIKRMKEEYQALIAYQKVRCVARVVVREGEHLCH